MPFSRKSAGVGASVIAFILFVTGALSLGGCKPSQESKSETTGPSYQFELVGQPEKTGPGVSVVSVRLVHLPDKKPVPNAVIFETRADMGPDGMGEMTAPVKALPESESGVYPFEIQPGMAGDWAFSLAAKIQGTAETARGSVTFTLER